MIRIMKADMYRIWRSKNIYITIALLLAVVMLTLFVFREAATGLVFGIVEYSETATLQQGFNDGEITSADAAMLALQNVSSMLLYFFIPMFAMVVLPGFSSGAVKNEISNNISRTKTYIARLLLSFLLCLMLLIANVALSILFMLPFDGLGYWGSGFALDIISSALLQSVVIFALVSVGVFLCYVTRARVMVTTLFMAFITIPVIFAQAISTAFDWVLAYMYFDLANQLMFFANMASLDRVQLTRGVVVSIIWLITTTVAGIRIFNKAEIA